MRGRGKRLVVRSSALGLGLAVLGIVTLLPTAAATRQPVGGAALTQAPDLSTVPKVESYLRSLGVDPKGVVIQRGAKNYAGPSCPGPAWNCTTALKVVQLGPEAASDDDDEIENRFVCRRDRGSGTVTQDATPPEQSCVIVQPGGNRNQATCEISTKGTTGPITQSCFITQGGARNSASAKLVAVMGASEGMQNVVQRIEILQTGGSSSNAFTASQLVLLGVAANKGGGDVDTQQDFHQIICGNQIASGSGSNTASVSQHGAAGALYSNAGVATIDQNTESLSLDCTANPPGAGPFADISGEHADGLSCAVEGGSLGSPKEGANSCARLQQESGSGRNKIDRQTQTNALAASVSGATEALIDQGRFDGGIDSTQDQKSNGLSTIVDSQNANQIASVKDVGFFVIDQDEDPRCCAAGHQLGNAGNTWQLRQDLTQRVFVNGALVDPDDPGPGFVEQNGSDFGNCTTTGTCNVNQKVSNNLETATNSCSDSSCDISTTCEAGFIGEGRATGPAAIQENGACSTSNGEITLRRAGRR